MTTKSTKSIKMVYGVCLPINIVMKHLGYIPENMPKDYRKTDDGRIMEEKEMSEKDLKDAVYSWWLDDISGYPNTIDVKDSELSFHIPLGCSMTKSHGYVTEENEHAILGLTVCENILDEMYKTTGVKTIGQQVFVINMIQAGLFELIDQHMIGRPGFFFISDYCSCC